MTSMDQQDYIPETGLRGLNRRLRALLSAATVIESESGKNGIITDILSFYRQTAIAELFYDRYIIAIAGMQGVGKTTLLKQLYDIPSGYIPENIGRGEKLPILVTEHPVEEIQTYVRRAERQAGTHDFELKELPISNQTFMEISKQPGEEDMWLELKVPYRYFNGSDKSFALLPGIEDVGEEDKGWQDFVRHALTLAATCIMVFDRAKLAQGQNRALLESVIRDFKTAKPIFALSSSDERSPEDNAQLKELVREHFSISPSEADRVVLKGTGKEFGNAWIDEMMDAVRKYAAIPREFRRNQVKHIDRLLTSFQAVLAKLQTELDRNDMRNEHEDDQDYRKHLQVYDQSANSLRRSVERALNPLLAAHQSVALKEMQDKIAKKDKPTKVKEFVLGKSYKGHLKFVRQIQDAWDKAQPEQMKESETTVAEDGGNSDRLYIGLKCANRFHGLINDHLKEFSVKQTKPNRLLAAKKERDTADDPESQPVLEVRQDIIDNLNDFFSDESADRSSSPVLMVESIKLIPIIALERLTESILLSQMTVNNENGQMIVERPSGELAEQLEKVKFPTGSIVRGAAVVFGVDAIDGTIHTVPALLQALGVSATTATMSVAVSLCGLLSLGFVAASVCRQIAKQDFKDEDAAITLIRQFKDSYQQMIMDHFGELMEEGRNRLENRLRVRLHKNESFVRWEKLRFALRDIQNYQIELQGNIHGTLGFCAELADRKLNWAYEAQRRFISSFQDDRVRELYTRNRQKDIFVAVFGPSQVGKTSLILRLIGVTPQHMAKVNHALRGGREEGRSSTATSMLYEASSDSYYYVRGAVSQEWVRCRDELELEASMRLLREQVEGNLMYSIQPVEIRIPKPYFAPYQSSDLHVRMMDLPGIYSSTPEEQDHVLRVIHHYLPQANLILLVNQAKQLASFQHFGVESIDEWRFVPDKFRIVLTHSVSANSIREMIERVPPEAFHRHFYEEFSRTVERFPAGEIKVYPLEYGKSWDQLRGREHPWFEAYDRLMEGLLEQLREDINESSNEYSQVRMNYRLYRAVEEKIREKEDWFSRGRAVLDERLSEIGGILQEYQGYLERLEAKRTELEELLGSLAGVELKPDIPALHVYTNGEKSVKGLRQAVRDRVDQMVSYADEALNAYLYTVEDSLTGHPDCSIPARPPLRRLKAGDLDETIRGMLVRLNSYRMDKYFTSKWERDLNEVNGLIVKIHKVGVKIVHDAIDAHWEKIHKALQGSKRKLQLRRKVVVGYIADQQAERAMVIGQLEAHEAKLEAFRRMAEKDRETARSFRRYVDECFEEAYAGVVSRINNKKTGSSRKWLYLMHLKSLQNEYRKLTEEA